MYAVAIVVAAAAWVSIPELVAPPRLPFPAGADAAGAQTFRGRARLAARLAAVRGDLWADYAAASSEGLQNDIAGDLSPTTTDAVAGARVAADRAVRLAPHDARMWLLIAAIDARLDWFNRRVEAPLKMSYYTGTSDPALMGLRLLVAARLEAISDPDLQLLVSGRTRTIVRSIPVLRPAIVAGLSRYAGAGAAVRRGYAPRSRPYLVGDNSRGHGSWLTRRHIDLAFRRNGTDGALAINSKRSSARRTTVATDPNDFGRSMQARKRSRKQSGRRRRRLEWLSNFIPPVLSRSCGYRHRSAVRSRSTRGPRIKAMLDRDARPAR